MSQSFNLDPVDGIAAGAIGEPGSRVFYIQARQADLVVSLVAEKGQVHALANHIEALLLRLHETRPTPPAEAVAELTLEQPVEADFRVGSMALGYNAERDLVLLQCDELVVPEDPEAEEPDDVSGATAHFWTTREQMRMLAHQAMEVVAAGRPLCELCGGPIDPDGHMCPSLNGHRERKDRS